MKILLPLDGAPCSTTAIDAVVNQFRPANTEVRLLHVVEWPKAMPMHLALGEGADCRCRPARIPGPCVPRRRSIALARGSTAPAGWFQHEPIRGPGGGSREHRRRRGRLASGSDRDRITRLEGARSRSPRQCLGRGGPSRPVLRGGGKNTGIEGHHGGSVMKRNSFRNASCDASSSSALPWNWIRPSCSTMKVALSVMVWAAGAICTRSSVLIASCAAM